MSQGRNLRLHPGSRAFARRHRISPLLRTVGLPVILTRSNRVLRKRSWREQPQPPQLLCSPARRSGSLAGPSGDRFNPRTCDPEGFEPSRCSGEATATREETRFRRRRLIVAVMVVTKSLLGIPAPFVLRPWRLVSLILPLWHRGVVVFGVVFARSYKVLTLRGVSLIMRRAQILRSVASDRGWSNHMKIGLIFRLLITILRYPAPTFCEHWGYWVQPDHLTKAEAKWLWRADARQ
jgi:hypothetical protein